MAMLRGREGAHETDSADSRGEQSRDRGSVLAPKDLDLDGMQGADWML